VSNIAMPKKKEAQKKGTERERERERERDSKPPNK